MVKVTAGKSGCDILDGIFIQNSFANSITACKTAKTYSFVSYLTRFDMNEGNVFLGCELTDVKVYNIALKLAQALDKNSVAEIKLLKQQYKGQKEFLKAREYLSRISKKIFDVYDKNYNAANMPEKAMLTLGITNIPSLDFLLLNSLTYFEKDGGSTTVDIISSILKNKNLHYSFDDIYNYLKLNKTKIKYNQITANYLAQKLAYNSSKIEALGITPKKTYIKEKIENSFINLKKAFKNNFVRL